MAEIRTVIGEQVHLHHLNLTVSAWRNIMANIERGNLPFMRFLDSTGRDILLNPRECAIIEFAGDPESTGNLNGGPESGTMDGTDGEEVQGEADADA